MVTQPRPAPPRTHSLKTWPPYFESIARGRKNFEVRREDDRVFDVGDTLHLREWEPTASAYTGRACTRTVSYVLRGGDFGLPPDVVVMGLLTPQLEEARARIDQLEEALKSAAKDYRITSHHKLSGDLRQAHETIADLQRTLSAHKSANALLEGECEQLRDALDGTRETPASSPVADALLHRADALRRFAATPSLEPGLAELARVRTEVWEAAAQLVRDAHVVPAADLTTARIRGDVLSENLGRLEYAFDLLRAEEAYQRKQHEKAARERDDALTRLSVQEEQLIEIGGVCRAHGAWSTASLACAVRVLAGEAVPNDFPAPAPAQETP